MNPYQDYVSSFAGLFATGKKLPMGELPFPAVPVVAGDAPVALIFSPHPDDECIVGGLALRLLRQSGMRIVNVAVTQGSNEERRQPRWQELKAACRWLGFELEQTVAGGLEKIQLQTRTESPSQWNTGIQVIATSLLRHRPRVIFFPHAQDWNSTHVGTHHLIVDTLKTMPRDFECCLVETEFWGQMAAPNLMVELTAADVADLLAALSFHVGEVKRNPYHLRLPAWLMDNVRRGAELVGGQGGQSPDFAFATLYRVNQWKNGRFEISHARKWLRATDNPMDGLAVPVH